MASWKPPEFVMEKILIPFFNTLELYKCWLWTRGYGLGWEHFEVIVLEWWWLLCFEKREMECVCVGGKILKPMQTHIFKFQSLKFGCLAIESLRMQDFNEWGGRGHINRAFNVHTLFRDKHECITVWFIKTNTPSSLCNQALHSLT